MSHRNARLTVHGRLLLVQRVRSGRPVAHVAAELGVSRATGYKWWRRWRTEGPAVLADRPSHAHRIPGRTSPDLAAQVVNLRRETKLGPHRIAALLGLPASTVHAVLTRHGLSRPAWLDRPTATVIRRYERDRPGELMHVDVKKLGRLRDGGGWRVLGRDSIAHRRAHTGYPGRLRTTSTPPSTTTPASPMPRSTPTRKPPPAPGFLRRAAVAFAAHGIDHLERVMTDNAMAYRRSPAWRDNFSPHRHARVRAWCAVHSVELVFTPTYGSWLNWIEAEFAALRHFALNGTDHRSHTEQNAAIAGYIRWRNARTQPKVNFAVDSPIRTWTEYPVKAA